MKERFLKAKHWQLFILTYGVPMLMYIIMMVSVFSSIELDRQDVQGPPSFMFDFFTYFPFIMILFVAGLFGWFWSVVMGLQSKLPEGVKMKITRFKVFFFFPLIYMTLIMLLMSTFMEAVIRGTIDFDGISAGIVVSIVVPCHLFWIFCMFHNLFFVAKTIKTVELQREVKFGDFVAEFFLIWFYPIGIWIVQPTINGFVEDEEYLLD